MNNRKKVLITLGVAEILTGFFLGFYYPRALSYADEFEERISSQYAEQIRQNPEITEEIEMQVYSGNFRRDVSVLSDTVRGLAHTNGKMFLALLIAGIITIVIGASIKSKKREIPSQ